MDRNLWFVLVGVLVLLAACTSQSPTCSSPYIVNGQSCCLDKDADGMCDAKDSQESVATSCELCPPRFVTQKEEVPVYRYVCENGSIMTEPGSCGVKVRSTAHLFNPHEDQDETLINRFTSRPACRGEYNAAEIYMDLVKAPQRIVIEVKGTPTGQFETLAVLNGSSQVLDDVYFYVGLCTSIECSTVTDARFPPENAFLIRASLFYAEAQATTKELLIDPTEEGDYGKKRC